MGSKPINLCSYNVFHLSTASVFARSHSLFSSFLHNIVESRHSRGRARLPPTGFYRPGLFFSPCTVQESSQARFHKRHFIGQPSKRDKMASEIIASITDAMDRMEICRKMYSQYEYKMILRILMHKIMGLRTFVLCLKKLVTDDTGFIYPCLEAFQESNVLEADSNCDHTDVGEIDDNIDSLEISHPLEYLFKRLKTFLNDTASYYDEYLSTIECFEQEIDQWYTSLSSYLPQASSSPVANEVEEIFSSILRNLEDFLSLQIAYEGVFVQQVVALKVNITFWRNFLHFASFLGTHQQQEFRDFLMNLEALAFSAAHFTVDIFSAGLYNAKVFSEAEMKLRAIHYHHGGVYGDPDALSSPQYSFHTCYNKVKSTVSALLLRINPFDNPPLYESHSLALESIKSSRESCVPNLDIEESSAVLLSILWEVLQFQTGPTLALKDRLQVLYEELRYLRGLLKKHPDNFDGEVRATIRAGIFDAGVIILSFYQKHDAVSHEVEELLGLMKVIRTEVEKQVVSTSMPIQSVTEDKMIIMTDSVKIFDCRREEIEVPCHEEIASVHTDQVISAESIPSTNEFVGFEAEKGEIIDRLTRGSKKLQVVAIVGMPGLGKTTLATRVYNESSVQKHFHIRAWCSISQEFNRRKVLLQLLDQIRVLKSNQPDEDYSKKSEEDLAQDLRRSLLQRRYLIYVDDVWETKAFDCLKVSFPGDSFGRILLTSRIGDVAKLDDQPHFLRQLTFSESLELLQMKAFPGKGLPPSLYDTAVKIAENCKGLPLIIVIVSGLLGTTKQEVWEEVLVSLTLGIISSTDQCQRTIELSYKHLPDHLKPCLLSLGAFPEDEDISVKRLIWLWIAEGFVRKNDSSSLEEVAADYLKNLIGRCLVMDGRKRNGGGIKTCRVHDLLLDFCVRKAIEENALHLLKGKEEISHFEESHYLRKLCVHSKMGDFIESKFSYPHLRSLSFFGENICGEVADISFIFRLFKLLRVLNMETLIVSSYEFPGEIGLLVRLRYLAVTVTFDISPSIGNLSNLETFIMHPVYETLVTMPDTFWNLQKLRHLYLLNMRGRNVFHGIILPFDSSCNMLELDSLSGLHSEHWHVMEKKLRKFPNIRRLKFWLFEFGNDHVNGSKVMSFSFLSQLESLTLSFDNNSADFEFIFPETIKQLNLSCCGLPWERISTIAKLPNLEVLKLLEDCFVGGRWQVEEGEFSKLRFLKLGYLDFTNWTGCEDQFPNLEKLVVEGCDELEEIPECLESVDTFEMIEVIDCPDRVESLFKTLADYLKDMGNSVLQFRAKEKAGSAEEEDDDSANEEDT